ncbi:MAG TPA: hypothetical protein VF519_03550 [Mycobacteriales bacterium]|jgi:predicted DNA-binding transcriptional regulator AlpA
MDDPVSSVDLDDPPAKPRHATSWTVRARVEVPDSSQYVWHPAALDRVAALLQGRGAVVAHGPGELVVSFGVEGATAREAQDEGAAWVDRVARLLGLEGRVQMVSVVSNAALLAELDAVPECAGLAETAAILGVSKQRVHQLTAHPNFPRPVFRLSATPVWLAADIRRFAAARAARRATISTT